MTLEHLEASFYEEGLKNYTHEDFVKAGLMDPFYANLKEVAKDEKSHEEFLTQALKGKSCEFNGPTNIFVYVLTGILTSCWSSPRRAMQVCIPCYGREDIRCSR